jgi:hypothetical protein
MMKLSDYILDTEGKLPPEDLINCCALRVMYNNKFCRIHGDFSERDFEDIDGNYEKYRIRRHKVELRDLASKTVFYVRTADCFVAPILARELYE